MRRPLLSVSAAALGFVLAATAPAAAGPIGPLPGAGSTTAAASTASKAPGIERVVFLLDGGSGFSGLWSGSGGASICIGCFVGGPPWDSGGGSAFGFGGQVSFGGQPGFGGGTAPGAGGGGAAGLTGLVSLPDLLPPASGNSFTLPFELFGTLNGYNIFGQGQLLFTGPGTGLATGAPFQSSEVPEPATLLLLSTGASALFLSARRRRRGAK